MYEIEIKTIIVDGLSIVYRVFGSDKAKQKLLLLHGWNTIGAASWENFILSFQKDVEKQNIQIIAPDMPGFGQSQEPESVWKVQNYVGFVRDFCDSLNLGSQELSLIGHSFGGAILSQFASENTNKLRKLILVAPAIIRYQKTRKQILIEKFTKFGKKLVSSQSLKKAWYKLIGSPDYQKTSERMAEIMKIVIREDLQATLKKINLPTLILWGSEDKYTLFNQAEIVHSQILGSKLVVFDGVNHGIHLNSVDRLSSEVKNFLDLT